MARAPSAYTSQADFSCVQKHENGTLNRVKSVAVVRPDACASKVFTAESRGRAAPLVGEDAEIFSFDFSSAVSARSAVNPLRSGQQQ